MRELRTHILIIDDDPLIRQMFGGLLATKGLDVLYAKDGGEGREVARRMNPDLILLDLRMPVMDGVKTARYLKSEKETQHIPIILLTNEDLSLEAQKAAKEIGIDDYVPKGADFSVLFEHIEQLLKSSAKK